MPLPDPIELDWTHGSKSDNPATDLPIAIIALGNHDNLIVWS